ncbi:hypothetical protein Sps_04051 [Shewanella psychrophila]|uniref:Uncharacterized protein n=1 Tax=Shewanella psychrophila TaxID=225848 RepID=A0A1S6HUC9_9GAMM|nr:hypothetical protein Sps_04051 [Shewanella psychrophila]
MGLAIIIIIFSILWVLSGTLTALFAGVMWGELVFFSFFGAVMFGWWKSVRKVIREYRALIR